MNFPNLQSCFSMDGYLHPSLLEDEESRRRGRLQVRFGLLGGALGILFAAFFLAMSYTLGGLLVAGLGISLAAVPWLVRYTGNLRMTGHLLGGFPLLAFTSLCVLDGGAASPGFFWLAAVPVCLFLVLDLKSAIWWVFICCLVVGAFVIAETNGITFLKLAPSDVSSSIDGASGFALFCFLAFLSLLLEKSRLTAAEETRNAKQKLEVLNNELVDLNRQKNEFLNIAAHDLKNPLSIICGYADLLREIESPTLEDIKSQSSEILRSGTYMLDIIENILDVRAIEDGQRRLRRERCSVSEIADDMLLTYTKPAGNKDITFANFSEGFEFSSWSDPRATRQILDNLVSNAIKYTPPGGMVEMRVRGSESEMIFEVQDSGPGLSEGDQAKLWSKFTKLSPTPTAGENANGLGLWIVKRLANEMGGDTFCRSELGKGSIFGLRLPLWTEDCQVEDLASKEMAEENGRSAFSRLIADMEAKAEEKGLVLPA